MAKIPFSTAADLKSKKMATSSRPDYFPLWAGLLIFSGLAPPLAGAAESTVAMSVAFDDGLVSATANNVATGDLVEAIARQAELRLVQHVELDRLVTLDVERQPLPELLAEVLKNDSYQLFQAVPGDDDSEEVIPGTLWIFSEGASLAPAATVFLEAVLYQGTYREKQEAIRELQRLGTAAAVETLSLALGDADARLRDAALGALSIIGSDEALAAIASAAMDGDPQVRAEAATALASGDSETSAQYLAMAIDDPDPRVRMAVVESLADVPFGTVPSQQAVATLTRALKDKDPKVRMSAVDAIEGLGGDIAYQTLMQARMDQDPEVAEVVNELLLSLDE